MHGQWSHRRISLFNHSSPDRKRFEDGLRGPLGRTIGDQAGVLPGLGWSDRSPPAQQGADYRQPHGHTCATPGGRGINRVGRNVACVSCARNQGFLLCGEMEDIDDQQHPDQEQWPTPCSFRDREKNGKEIGY